MLIYTFMLDNTSRFWQLQKPRFLSTNIFPPHLFYTHAPKCFQQSLSASTAGPDGAKYCCHVVAVH